LFGAAQTTVWLYDRSVDHLILGASSDRKHVMSSTRIAADDPLAAAASAMRRAHAELHPAPGETATATVTIPLFGYRRALGVIVAEHARVDTGSEFALLDRADEVGRRLSSAIENTQLIDDVVRTRQQREKTSEPRYPQSDKLAVVDQVAAGIAHQLNSPLQAVLEHLEVLRAAGDLPEPIRGEIQIVSREADGAARILDNLLAFTASRPFGRQAVNLDAVLQKVVALRAPACRAADIEVVRHYDEKLPRVQSDPLLLQQVFLNIVTNAERAVIETGRGGRIEINTIVSPDGERLVTSVRDTGNGIPADALLRLFEPFYTTKDAGKGIGLGLAIACDIVHEHGGQIAATNHPDGGAVFTVELPIRPPAEQTGST
jgi:signal transduction histidine kinase